MKTPTRKPPRTPTMKSQKKLTDCDRCGQRCFGGTIVRIGPTTTTNPPRQLLCSACAAALADFLLGDGADPIGFDDQPTAAALRAANSRRSAFRSNARGFFAEGPPAAPGAAFRAPGTGRGGVA